MGIFFKEKWHGNMMSDDMMGALDLILDRATRPFLKIDRPYLDYSRIDRNILIATGYIFISWNEQQILWTPHQGPRDGRLPPTNAAGPHS